MDETTRSAIYRLISQVEIADFRDENGHSLKRLAAYEDLIALVLTGESQTRNTDPDHSFAIQGIKPEERP